MIPQDYNLAHLKAVSNSESEKALRILCVQATHQKWKDRLAAAHNLIKKVRNTVPRNVHAVFYTAMALGTACSVKLGAYLYRKMHGQQPVVDILERAELLSWKRLPFMDDPNLVKAIEPLGLHHQYTAKVMVHNGTNQMKENVLIKVTDPSMLRVGKVFEESDQRAG
jgi:hypothetical protein